MLANFEIYYLLEFARLHSDKTDNIMMENVWKMAMKKYTYITGEEVTLANEIDRLKVHNWLKNNSSLELLNDLLCGVVKRLSCIENTGPAPLDNRDAFLLNNISLVEKIILEEEDYLLHTMGSNLCDIPEITPDEAKEIVRDILEEIDQNGEWLNIYLDGIDSGHIIWLNELDDEQFSKLRHGLGMANIKDFNNTCIYFGDKNRYLFLNYYGNIMDVVYTIHEVVHYINEVLDNGRNVTPIIHEFPSIFYEMYTLKYLNKLGYQDEEIMKAYYNRQIDTYTCINEIKEIIYYLSLYLTKGNISIIDDSNRIDKCLKKLINSPYILFNCYPYIIGEYLARNAIHQSEKDKTLLSMIKYITEHLSKIEVNEIFNLLDVNQKIRILK